jgi:hypothetical protein
MYVHIHNFTYIHTWIYTFIYIYIYICILICTYTDEKVTPRLSDKLLKRQKVLDKIQVNKNNINELKNTDIFASTGVRSIYICIYVYVNVYIYVYIYVYLHVYIEVYV